MYRFIRELLTARMMHLVCQEAVSAGKAEAREL
jgi:hypothetical protein